MPVPVGAEVYWVGSAGPFFYDPVDLVNDPDLDYDGAAAPPVQALITNGQLSVATVPTLNPHVLRFEDLGGIVGNVSGPVGGSTDNAIARWDGATGLLLDDSALFLDNAGDLSKVATDLLLDCGANKTLELTQVTYDDLYFEIAPKTTGAGKPTLANFSGNVNQWQMAINDISELRPVELKHDGKEGTQIELHVHWGTNGLDGTDRGVKWEIDYTWANNLAVGGTTAFAAVTTISIETQIPANTPDKTHMYTSVVSFTPAAWKIGALVLMSLKRIASVTDPTPTSDPWVFMVGIHYQVNTLGSRQITTK